jgi:Fic family protein
MAELTVRTWEPSWDAPTREARRGGRYEAYVPDPLDWRPLALGGELATRAAGVEASVRALSSGTAARGLEGLARFLLRSEAIASSRIEGMHVSAQRVALAELAESEPVGRGRISASARFVANNIAVLRSAATDLAEGLDVTVGAVDGLHRALLPEERHHGLRTVQNWIGGSGWNPLGAQFVPPPETHVRPLMEDLVAYAAGGIHAPLVQAALVHAQFETIHHYTVGNGRVGRALIHTVLTRRGLTPAAILPISLVLLTHSDAYVDGLTAYRYLGPPDADAARAGTETWLSTFVDAAGTAVDQVTRFASDLTELRADWAARLSRLRAGRGVRDVPRSGSGVARLLDLLPEAPLVTAATVRRLLDVSAPAAHKALDELTDAGVLTRRTLERGTRGYFAQDVFDLLTFAERRLASTRWDTRESTPRRAVPARPHS